METLLAASTEVARRGGVIKKSSAQQVPGKVIYRLCDIEAYENECLVSSTAEFRKHTKPSDQFVTTALP